MPLPRQTAVLVVGAGPTGLLLAAELQRRGVPTLLIDARAHCVHRLTRETVFFAKVLGAQRCRDTRIQQRLHRR